MKVLGVEVVTMDEFMELLAESQVKFITELTSELLARFPRFKHYTASQLLRSLFSKCLSSVPVQALTFNVVSKVVPDKNEHTTVLQGTHGLLPTSAVGSYFNGNGAFASCDLCSLSAGSHWWHPWNELQKGALLSDAQLDILQNFSKSFKAMKGYFPSPPLYRGVLFYNKGEKSPRR